MRDGTDAGGLSDAEAREIAKQLVREQDAPPGDRGRETLAQAHELPPADEDRVEQALVNLGAASPEHTTMAERDAQPPG